MNQHPVARRLHRHLRALRTLAQRQLNETAHMKLEKHRTAAYSIAFSRIEEINRAIASLMKGKLSVVVAYLRKREQYFRERMRLWEFIGRTCAGYLAAVRHCALYRALRELTTSARFELRAAVA